MLVESHSLTPPGVSKWYCCYRTLTDRLMFDPTVSNWISLFVTLPSPTKNHILTAEQILASHRISLYCVGSFLKSLFFTVYAFSTSAECSYSFYCYLKKMAEAISASPCCGFLQWRCLYVEALKMHGLKIEPRKMLTIPFFLSHYIIGVGLKTK